MRPEKLGSAARQMLFMAGQEGTSGDSTPIRVLIRVRDEPDDQQRRHLTEAGAQVHTVAGDVVTASLRAGDLGRLTEVDAVAYVELSEPLRPEKGTETPDK